MTFHVNYSFTHIYNFRIEMLHAGGFHFLLLMDSYKCSCDTHLLNAIDASIKMGHICRSCMKLQFQTFWLCYRVKPLFSTCLSYRVSGVQVWCYSNMFPSDYFYPFSLS
jgi:hypothetical protein